LIASIVILTRPGTLLPQFRYGIILRTTILILTGLGTGRIIAVKPLALLEDSDVIQVESASVDARRGRRQCPTRCTNRFAIASAGAGAATVATITAMGVVRIHFDGGTSIPIVIDTCRRTILSEFGDGIGGIGTATILVFTIGLSLLVVVEPFACFGVREVVEVSAETVGTDGDERRLIITWLLRSRWIYHVSVDFGVGIGTGTFIGIAIGTSIAI